MATSRSIDLAPLRDRAFLFNVGAMKSGTSWLYRALSTHPELAFPEEKEPHFLTYCFGQSDHLTPQNRLDTVKRIFNNRVIDDIEYGQRFAAWMRIFLEPEIDARWYLRIFESGPQTGYLCDFSNLYCQMTADRWTEVARNVGKARIMYTLRDPAARLWSEVAFANFWGNRGLQLEGMSAREFADLLAGGNFRAQSAYGPNYQTLRQVFGDTAVRLNFQETFAEAPLATLRAIEDWLAIGRSSYADAPIAQRVNAMPGKIEMPPAFVEAAKPIVDQAFEDMDRAGLPYPRAWLERWQARQAGPQRRRGSAARIRLGTALRGTVSARVRSARRRLKR